MGIVIEFPLLTGLAALMEIGWLVWLSLICGLRAAAGRTAPQREDKPTKTNQLTRPFSLFSIWLNKVKSNWEKRRAAQFNLWMNQSLLALSRCRRRLLALAPLGSAKERERREREIDEWNKWMKQKGKKSSAVCLRRQQTKEWMNLFNSWMELLLRRRKKTNKRHAKGPRPAVSSSTNQQFIFNGNWIVVVLMEGLLSSFFFISFQLNQRSWWRNEFN